MNDLASAAVLSIGTELTRGEIQNTNAAWLADRLSAIGFEVSRLESVPDDSAAIAAALSRLSQENVLVVATGGLGPTTDDITSAAVATWLAVPRVRDPQVLAELEEGLRERGRPLTASNAQQADFPAGATILDNAHGTAPGFRVSRGRCTLFFMPGVPHEMRPMFERHVEPAARALVRGGAHMVRLRCFGLPESVINDRLAGLEAEHRIQVAYRAHFPEVEVKLLARDVSVEAARGRAEAAAMAARSRLEPAVYAQGAADLPAVVAHLLRSKGLTLGLAESCTGGLVAALLTEHPASAFFMGGVVSYANSVKVGQLGVDPTVLAAEGAVSAAVARQMADGARRVFGADLSLALTGIAGPTGATPQKPVGLVYYALSAASGTQVREVNVSQRPRQRVQLYAAWCGLELIRQHLL